MHRWCLLLFVMLTVLVASLPAASATITWRDNSSNEYGFLIERALGAGTFVPVGIVGANVTSYTDRDLTPGLVVRYRVCAYNVAGRSDYSNEVSYEADANLPPPEIQPIAAQALPSDGTPRTIDVTFNGFLDGSPDLDVVASSSRPSLVGHPVVSGSSATSRRLTLTPVAGQSGEAVITVAVSNGQRIAYRRFTVTVSAGAGAMAPLAMGVAPERSSTRLVNVSARGTAGSGAETLVVGLYVADHDTPVLVRAIGPALQPFVGASALPDPVLSLYAGSRMIEQSRAWQETPELAAAVAAAGAFPLPSASQDAGLLQTLPPGTYTAQVTGAGRSGMVLAEVYDLSAGHGGRLMNLSCRSAITGHAGDLVIGFVVRGSKPLRVLVRAVGQTLRDYGVTGAVGHPTLTIYQGDQPMLTLGRWRLTPELLEASFAVGAFPLTHAADAAAVMALPPGTYTAVIATTDRRGGIVLAELYDVP
jgi:hypothetical protein